MVDPEPVIPPVQPPDFGFKQRAGGIGEIFEKNSLKLRNYNSVIRSISFVKKVEKEEDAFCFTLSIYVVTDRT